MDIYSRFSREAADAMKADIAETGGCEVFWSGRINDEGIVESVTAGARGNGHSVVIHRGIAREGHVLIHNHPGGNLLPSEADQAAAAGASDTSLGFYIIDNDVSRVYVVVEPVRPKKMRFLKEKEASFYLSADGPLAQASESYEERPSQIQLAEEIARAFNESKIGVFEAGTGVGKSFAYLIPAVLWAVSNKERVIVSTGTINLQQQLFEKDIPLALKITGKNVKSVLLKGRQNYVCLRRLSDAEEERSLFDDDAEMIDVIRSWTKETPTGSRSDLSFVPPDSVWSRINSESDACLGGRCPHREECFVMRMRKEASDASLIVVNHHLLFADIESRMSGAGYEDAAVLPPYRRIVFDEAHGIEDSATSFFSEIVTRFKVMKQVNLLFRNFRGTSSGFLVQAAAVSSAENCTERAAACASSVKDSLMALDQAAMLAMEDEFSLRLHASNAARFCDVLSAMSRLRSSLAVFNDLVREVLEGIDDRDADIPAVWEAKTVLHRLESFASLCSEFCRWNEKEGTVFWMQKVKIPPKAPGDSFTVFVQFIQTPLDIAPLMNAGVFEPMETVVCTSATLRTDRNFSYWMRRTGISLAEKGRVLQQDFESPFPYKTNVLFAVPDDAPFPDSQYFQSYAEDAVLKLVLAAGGRTLVLFTSYDSLKFSYNASRAVLAENGIAAFKQGDDDRFRLLEKFKEDTKSVLFATDSFWEGVDVPGSSLSQVIIAKLPFAVPNDPVFSARSEALERQGGNSFMQLSLPQAVIKFRQGFGRLIRRSDDKGAVVVLDRRIVEKKYGGMFIRSVPQTKRMYSPLADITEAVRRFLS